MGKEPWQPSTRVGTEERATLRFLDASQVAMVDEALTTVGEFGEVRLVVEKGRLRYVVTQRSFDALKWQPGGLSRDSKLSRLSL